MKELTERMRSALEALAKSDRPMTPNEIGQALGFRTGHLGTVHCNHAGRTMGPAQRVIFALTALRNRGLVRMTRRRDGLSGTAYEATTAGRLYVTPIVDASKFQRSKR